MSDTSPEPPEQVRGETLEPVSPKPLHYPSPSNIPILEASMDPAFSETVTQTMQQHTEHVPSVVQHSAPITNIGVAGTSIPESTPFGDAAMADANGITGESSAGSNSAEASMSNPANTTSEPTNAANPPPLPSEQPQPQPSENIPESSTVDITPAPEASSINVAAPTAAEPPTPVLQDAIAGEATLPSKPADPPSGNIDYSALLANLSHVIPRATSVGSANATPAQLPSEMTSSPSASISAHPNLPPKPPAQEKPSVHPIYTPGDDLRNYHPHLHNSGSVSMSTPPLPNLSTNGLPPPPHTFQTPQSATQSSLLPVVPQTGRPAYQEDEDTPFDPQTQQLYDQFIAFEQQNVRDGQWDKFPMGSRLFVGNIATEKVHKRDVFRKFYRYGQIAQISLKQAYGFVQFMDAATCSTALAMEQATKIRGREIHLEISKPAKSTKNQQMDRNRRRSRSPDYGRGPMRIDRYSGSPRDRDNRRSRDEWRRSPSPRRGYGGRDDRYDRRRRSPSPYGSRDHYNAPPQQRDELDLPWRQPGQVPDIQIIVVEPLDQEYVRWVDNAMKSRGVRVDVLMLTPRWPEEAVVRRQILEGVLAVVHLTRADRMKNKVSLRLFNRSGGANNVTFDQYVDLDPTTAADLVLRAKRSSASAPAPALPQQYPPPPQQHGNYAPRPPLPQQYLPTPPLPTPQAPPPANNPDLARIMAGINSQGRPGQASPTGITPDVARLLGGMGQAPPGQPMPNSYQSTPAQAPVPVSTPMQLPTSQTSPDIQQLLANLTNYKPPA